MRRIQISLTEEHDRLVARMATDLGISKAEAIRRLLDRALGAGDAEADARQAIRATAGLLADYPDWEEWQREVRGRTADDRLRGLRSAW